LDQSKNPDEGRDKKSEENLVGTNDAKQADYGQWSEDTLPYKTETSRTYFSKGLLQII